MGNDWYSVPLAECGEWLSGGTPSKQNDEYWAGTIPWVSPKDMYVGRIEDTEDHLTLEGVEAGSRCVPANTILFVVRSMTLRHTFQVAITNRDVSFNQDLKAIVPYDWVYPDFLYYTLKGQSDLILSLVDEASHGTTRLKTNTIGSLPIPFPPTFEEQVAIAQVVRALDDKIEANRRQNETLEATARAIFKSWFVDFDPVHAKARGETPPGMDAETAALFPDSFKDSELGLIPRGWRVEPIGDAVKAVGGSTPSTAEPAFWDDGTIHWATPKDLSNLSSPVLLDTDRRITELGLGQISSGLLPKGTLLLSSRAPVGYLAIAEIPVAINQGFIAMICDANFPSLYALFWTETNLDVIQNRASGTTFQEISKRNFRPILALVPSPDVLRGFVEIVEPLYRQIVRNLEETRTLAETRDALLPRLVSGELRVGEMEDIS